MGANKKIYDLFISYSREDYIDVKTNKPKPGSVIADIRHALDVNKIDYFIDVERIEGAEKYARKIEENLGLSKALLFISSETSNDEQREWVRREIHYAKEVIHIDVIPLLIDDSEFSKGTRLLLCEEEKIFYYTDPKKAIEKLVKSVATIRAKFKAHEEKRKARAGNQEIG